MKSTMLVVQRWLRTCDATDRAECEDLVAATVKELTPLQRRGEPDDFVGPVIFLCSDASRFVSGHILLVDGGYCAL